jgi:hypothetical protein
MALGNKGPLEGEKDSPLPSMAANDDIVGRESTGSKIESGVYTATIASWDLQSSQAFLDHVK